MRQGEAKPFERIMLYIHRQEIVRPLDIEAIGLPREGLLRLRRQGKIVPSGPWTLHNPGGTDYRTSLLCGGGQKVSGAVFCLLSALFHEITTQSPAVVWIAVRQGARKPALKSPALRIVRLAGTSLTDGIESHNVEGVPVRVYYVAKTVADCFKFETKSESMWPWKLLGIRESAMNDITTGKM